MYTPVNSDPLSAGIGNTEDLSASASSVLFKTPAALGLVKKQFIGINSRFIMGSASYHPTEFGNTESGRSRLTNYNLNWNPGELYIVTPLSIKENKFSAGIGVFRKYDFSYFAEFAKEDLYNENSYIENESNGGINFLSLGLGSHYRYLFGGASFNTSIKSEMDRNDVDSNEYSKEVIKEKNQFSGHYTAFGLGLNINNIICAINYESPLNLKVDGHYSRTYHDDSDDHSEQSDYQYTLTYPSFLTLNVQYQWNQLKVFSKGGLIDFKSVKLKNDTLNVRVFPNIKNGYCLNIGAEYHYKYFFRLGYGIQRVPLQDYFDGVVYIINDGQIQSISINTYLDTPKVQYTYSAGAGIPLNSHISMDLAFEYKHYSRISTSMSSGYFFESARIHFFDLCLGLKYDF